MREALHQGMLELAHWGAVEVDTIPDWVKDLSFTSANHNADHWVAGGLVKTFRGAEATIRKAIKDEMLKIPSWPKADAPPDLSPLPPWAASEDVAQLRMVVALTRLAFGAAMEAALTRKALALSHLGVRPSTKEAQATLARLYNDAFLVAVWTSAHAQYVTAVQSGVEEPPPPELSSIPNAANEFDLSDLFSRRTCHRLCPKKAQPLLQVLQRSTNPGSRGWNTLLETALSESQATRLVLTNTIVVALSTLHPFLHPALRPPWDKRMQTIRVGQHLLVDANTRAALTATAPATKEAVRRMLSSTMASSMATQAALAFVGHPVGLLTSPPLALPAVGMEAAMAAFAHAGQALVASNNEVPCYASVVNASFALHTSRSEPSPEVPLRWDPPWLGKGTPNCHQKVPLMSVASDLWAQAFRANFLVFWAHCMSNQLRASRLDAAQHEAIHGLNAATQLTLQLPREVVLDAQRLALGHTSAGILTIEEAAQMLGIPGVRGTSSNGGAKNPGDALRALSAAGAEATGRLLTFARVAWISEEILIVDLGPRTRARQLTALCRRLGLASGEEARLPIHATHLHGCVECRRVANAFALDANLKPGSSYNELGVSSSMLCTTCSGPQAMTTNIRCAKRSSAALRTAITFEEQMLSREIETAAVNLDGTVAALTTACKAASTSSDSGVAARVRRDAKNALEQRSVALACGEEPMLCIPVVGRALRVWNDWYALCSWCGAMLRVLPHHRFGAEICCLRCDADMLGMATQQPQEEKLITCRYCGRADREARRSSWKTIKAPHDIAGDNKNLPQPLRTVTFCPTHWRSWLAGAHRVLPTRVILSHIAHNAKPLFSSGEGRRRSADELGFEAPEKHGKRRKGSKGKEREEREGMQEEV